MFGLCEFCVKFPNLFCFYDKMNNNNNGNRVNRHGRTPEQEDAFINFMIAFLSTMTYGFSLIQPINTMLGSFLIRLSVNDIHDHN